MATKIDLIIEQGADFSYSRVLVDGNNDVRDLTGYTIAAQARRSYTSSGSANTPGAVFDLTSSVDSNTSTISLSANNVETANMVPQRYQYDIEITSPGNVKERVQEGKVFVKPGTTQV